MKRLSAFILSLCLTLPLCSCYDSREIDQTAYVIAVGIDQENDGFKYTFQISSPLAMGSGGEGVKIEGGEENTRVENIVIGASDLYEARNMLNNFLSKRINLSHLKIIAVSFETAKEGLLPHMTFLLREREVRPNTHLCICEESAEDFLRGVNPALEANTAEYYDLIAKNGSIYAPPKTLREFINEESMFASSLPIGVVSKYENSSELGTSSSSPMRISASKSEFSGLCLLKDYKAAGTLSPQQSSIFGLICGKIDEADLSFLNNKTYHTVRLTPQKPARFSVSLSDAAVTINMRIDFTAEINSASANITEDEIEDYIEKEVYSLFLGAQKAGCDIFGAGNCLRRKCRTVSEWESIDWDNKFKHAYFSPNITVISERSNSGTM